MTPAASATPETGSPSVDFGQLYRRCAPVVLRRVRQFVSPGDAEEVMHEVFVRAMEKLDTFDGKSSAVTWLYRIATNHCLNRVRNEGRRRQLLDTHAGDVPGYRRQAPVQEASVFLGQLWRSVDEELAQIGTYYYVDGMTHDEIARVMNCSPRTVGNRLGKLMREAKAAAGSQP